MPPPPRPERLITLTSNTDSTELRLDIHDSLTKWPSDEQDGAKAIFRIAVHIYDPNAQHQADHLAAIANPGQLALGQFLAYTSPTTLEMDHWVSNGQKKTARRAEIQHISAMLLTSLLEACATDARFSHLNECKYIVQDRNAYKVVTTEMLTNYWSLPGVRSSSMSSILSTRKE